MRGDELINQITTATGLPDQLIHRELENLIIHRGLDKDNVSVEEIRQLLAVYLQTVLISAKEELDSSGPS